GSSSSRSSFLIAARLALRQNSLAATHTRPLGSCAVSPTIGIDRFQCADNYLIGVSQEHVDEPEAGSFEQADPPSDRQVVSNAIGMAGAPQRRAAVAVKRGGPRPETLPILARGTGEVPRASLRRSGPPTSA